MKGVIFSEENSGALFVSRKELTMKKHNALRKMILAAFFLALSYVMPYLTGQIPEIGAMLCPLHIPVLLCGFICSWPWGLTVGFIAPIMRSFLTGGFPPLFPTAICMAFELAAYGFFTGLFHKIFPRKKQYIYLSLLASMIIGRIVWGVAMLVCMGIKGGAFTFGAFIAGAFTNAIPGIIVQIVIIPILVIILENTKMLKDKE